MKNKIKNILNNLFGEINVKYSNLKKNEIKMKLFLSSDKAKEKYIEKKFKTNIGYKIDFNKEPKTFNEKIQFRKLYDKNPLYSICADKYRVREYVKNKIGEKYLIPLLLVTDKLTEEQWDRLPNQFVAKANHNSGPVQIVKDKSKVNKKEIIKELNNQLKLDYGVLSLEKFYSNISRKIIVEKYLKNDIEDYRFHIFKKSCNIIMERTNSLTKTGNMYDGILFKKLNFGNGYNLDLNEYRKPQNYNEMLLIVKQLGEDFDYVRVDLYNLNGKIFFGELTFCESSGFGRFSPEEWDLKLGKYWKQKKLK